MPMKMLLVAVVWMRGAMLYELCINQRSAAAGDTWQPGPRRHGQQPLHQHRHRHRPAAAARI